MTEEEIEKRISVCEERRRSYLEVGNTKRADKYSNEIHKWDQLLNKLDPKRDEQLRDYKMGYERLERVIAKIIKRCDQEISASTIQYERNHSQQALVYKVAHERILEILMSDNFGQD